MKAKTSFKESLKKHFRRHGSITQLQALERYGSWSLSSRISDLSNEGWRFEKQPVKVKTRYGAKTIVTKYILKKEA